MIFLKKCATAKEETRCLLWGVWSPNASVSSSGSGLQPIIALERATEVQIMHNTHTVASTSIYRTVEIDVEEHVGTSGYGMAVCTTKDSANHSSLFAPKSSQEGIEAETRLALFLAKHNVAFLVSDHVSKLFICSPTRKLSGISDARGQKLLLS